MGSLHSEAKMDVQQEKAYQKQPGMTELKCRDKSRSSRKGARFTKSIGLGYKIPITGNVSIRGKILRGVVHNNKMKNTITLRRDYLHYISKYRRYEKRHKMISAHCSPCFDARPGDMVMVGQCRPLSKTVKFNVISLTELADRTGSFKQ